jgi:uncharacterized membrane protein YoaK (UPF0700 family)
MKFIRVMNHEHHYLMLMLALTFSTGVIDAVGYLGLDRVFTGNMTGNVVIIGMALTGDTDLPLLGPLVALAGFGIGAAIGGLAMGSSETAWSPVITRLMSVVAAVLAGVVVVTAVRPDPGAVGEPVITVALGLAMGVQAAVARHLAITDITTVVVTSTITGLFADSAKRGQGSPRWVRRTFAIMLIGAGAAAGAAALLLGLAWGVGLSAVITVAVAWIGHRRSLRLAAE